MSKTKITAHMVVKDDDRFVYFAIQSVLPYVDTFLITDTGSCDQTVALIQSIKSDKIIFRQTICQSKSDVTAVRGAQLESTKTDWFWVVDGDEIYPKATAEEVVKTVNNEDKLEGIVVRRYDLLGDVYHRQAESVGSYHLFGQTGHFAIRLLNKRAIPGLHLAGVYPLEGYYDNRGVEVIHHQADKYYLTRNHLYHTMYLQRSSGDSFAFNRGKYKVETGIKLKGAPPEVFSLPRPSYLRDPLTPRSQSYELLARIITPFKKFKRQYFDYSNNSSV